MQAEFNLLCDREREREREAGNNISARILLKMNLFNLK